MVLIGLKLLGVILLLVGPATLAGRKFGMARALGAFGVTLVIFGGAGLISPVKDALLASIALVVGVLVWAGWIVLAPDSWLSFMQRLMGSPAGSLLVIALYSTLVPLGNLEWIVRLGVNMGYIEAHTPMNTRIMGGVEDWRDEALYDDRRVQDPVLFWRSKSGVPPFSAQGFKSTIEMEVPKPANIFRIMAYGDSNTEGGRGGDWTIELFKLLQLRSSPELTYEVINAGVAGYSSYQGAQRFFEEWEKYEPDLVLVSFGWNDLPEALDQPDKAYKVNSAALAEVLRVLTKYKTFQAIQHAVLSDGMAERKAQSGARVPLPDYLDNMHSFSEVARANGFDTVFLTRPYRATTAEILQNTSWRSGVPGYNEALIRFAQENGEYLIDVQGYFENETTGLFIDETHFTDEGMTVMGHFMERELDRYGLLPDNKGE